MPQPLSNLNKKFVIHIANSNDSPSSHRPKLALFAMSVIAEWSILDSWLNSLFVTLLGSETDAATTIYTSLSGGAAKKAAFQAIANKTLIGEQLEVFNIIMAKIGKAANQRNNIAHWVWGHAPDLPDAVLIGDPAALMLYSIALQKHSQLRPGRTDPIPDMPYERIFIYRQGDFEELSKTINKLMGWVMEFKLSVDPVRFFPEDNQPFEQLLQQPEIQQALLRAHRKTQATQQPSH